MKQSFISCNSNKVHFIRRWGKLKVRISLFAILKQLSSFPKLKSGTPHGQYAVWTFITRLALTLNTVKTCYDTTANIVKNKESIVEVHTNQCGVTLQPFEIVTHPKVRVTLLLWKHTDDNILIILHNSSGWNLVHALHIRWENSHTCES